MKNWRTLFLMLTAAVWAFSACDDDDPENPAPNPPETSFSVSLSVTDVQATSAKVTAHPSDSLSTYYLSVLPSGELENVPVAQVVEKLTAAEDFDACLHIGAFETVLEGLAPATTYTIVTFKYASGRASAYTSHSFETPAGEVSGDKFTISDMVTDYQSLKVHVKPNSLSQKWYYYVMLKSSYDEYLAKEGERGPLVHTYYYWNNVAVDNSMNIGDYLSLFAISGERDLNIGKLTQGTDYVFIVAYVDPANTDPTQLYDSDYTAIPFSTQKADGNHKPVIEYLGQQLTRNDDGTIDITVTLRADIAKDGKFRLSTQSQWPEKDFGDFMNNEDQAFTMANMMGKALSEDQLAQLTSPAGCTFSYNLTSEDFEELNPLVFAIWVSNEQGLRTAKAIPVGE